jgi:hypothetical protein
MTKEQVLRAAGELLKDPKNRCVGQYRKVDSDGNCSYCLAGALAEVIPPGTVALHEAFKEVHKKYGYSHWPSANMWDAATPEKQESIVQWLLTFPEESQ